MLRDSKGFTMGEMVIVIAIIAILAALIAPLAIKQIDQKRFDACREELEVIKKAIVGDSSIVENGTRSSFGFIGDLGREPRTLDDLVNQNGLPSWQQTSGVWWGWRGPYINEYTDPWGNQYNYQSFYGVSGSLILARIWSDGPDGINNNGSGDDMVMEIRMDEGFSMISGNTSDSCGAAMGYTNITIYYPNLTSLTSVTVSTTQSNPIYNPTNLIPIGVRRLTVQTPTLQQLIFINNGPNTIVNLRQPGPCT